MSELMLSQDDLVKLLDLLSKGASVAQLTGVSKETLEGLCGVARNLYVAGNYKDAQVVFQALSIYDANDMRFWMGLGGCRQALEEYERAAEAYQMAAVASNLKNPEPLLYAVRCLVKLNRREDAIAGLQALLTFGGDDKDPAQAACLKQAEALLEMLKGAQK